LVLSILYFAVVTPVGFLVRMFYDPMERKLERQAQTYWIAHAPSEGDDYLRQS
jgi:hypothetical protein